MQHKCKNKEMMEITLKKDGNVLNGKDCDHEHSCSKWQNPYHIFPHLIWIFITREIGNSKDVIQLLNVFPELEQVTHKSEILFDEVFPLLFRDINKRDVLACRAISKRLKHSVDSFLESHPSKQPHNPESLQVQCHDRYSDLTAKGLHRVKLYEPEGFSAFQKKFSKDTSPSTYFVGRCVSINLDRGPLRIDVDYWVQHRISSFYQNMEQLLNRCGIEIWNVQFPLPAGSYLLGETQDQYEGFVKCLKKLGNLKSFRATVLRHSWTVQNRRDDQLPEFLFENISSQFSLPELPFLETIDFGSTLSYAFGFPMKHIFHQFMCKYSQQIRKLCMDLSFWRNCYGTRLPKLTELKLYYVDYPEKLKDLLDSLDAPLLQKLTLYEPLIPLCDILKVIQKHSIKVLTIHRYNIKCCPVQFEDLPVISSVQALTVYFNGIDLPLLYLLPKTFPSLEYLELNRRNGSLCVNHIGNLLCTYHEPACQHDNDDAGCIWKMLPKLKMLVFGDKRIPRYNQ